MKRKNSSDSRRETVTPTLLWVADVVVFAALLLLVFVLVRPRPASTPSGVLAQTASITSTGTSTASVARAPDTTSTSASTLLTPTGTLPSTPSATRMPSSTPVLVAPSPSSSVAVGEASPTPGATNGVSPTSTVANTASATPSATDVPSPTLVPTPLPSVTPLPTYTSFPTQTPLPTYTLYPTATPLPTYTPLPPPTPAVQLGSDPVTIVLATDADVLLGPNGAAKTAERNKVRQEIRKEFSPYSSQRAGIALTFGTSPQPAEGNRLAAEVNRLLLEELPDMFDVSVLRDYHIINADRSQRGRVEVEVYFLTAAP
jgi:hypothetical protein